MSASTPSRVFLNTGGTAALDGGSCAQACCAQAAYGQSWKFGSVVLRECGNEFTGPLMNQSRICSGLANLAWQQNTDEAIHLFFESFMSKTPKKFSQQRSLIGSEPALRKRVPHGFVLDAIAELQPTTRAMFGALAVYVADRIVFILRDRPTDPQANGVWLAIPVESQRSLSDDFPNARPVRIMGKDISGWRLLAVDADDFETSARHACELVVKGDSRIGKVPDR